MKISSICNGEKNVFHISKKNAFTFEAASAPSGRWQLTPFCFVFENTENSARLAKLSSQESGLSQTGPFRLVVLRHARVQNK